MTVADLTIPEFFGLQAVALAMFYAAGMAIRAYDHHWTRGQKVHYWTIMLVGFGAPVYLGLTVLLPGLPTF